MISFREKSLWVSLLASVVIASIYGDNLLNLLSLGLAANNEDIAALVFRIVIAFVVLEVLLHIALAMDNEEGANSAEDEREKDFRLRANETGYWILSIGVVACIIQQMINANVSFEGKDIYSNLALARIELKLMAIFWLSEVARFAMELYYFRRDS